MRSACIMDEDTMCCKPSNVILFLFQLDGYKEIEKSKQEKKEEASNILKDITKDIDAASVKKNDLIGQKVALDREVTKKLVS